MHSRVVVACVLAVCSFGLWIVSNNRPKDELDGVRRRGTVRKRSTKYACHFTTWDRINRQQMSGRMRSCHLRDSHPPPTCPPPSPHASLKSPSGNMRDAPRWDTHTHTDHFHITFTAVVLLHTFTGRPSLRFKTHARPRKTAGAEKKQQARHLVAARRRSVTSHARVSVS